MNIGARIVVKDRKLHILSLAQHRLNAGEIDGIEARTALVAWPERLMEFITSYCFLHE